MYSQTPIFTQTNNKVIPDSIRFNFKTKKALVWNSRTEQNEFKIKSHDISIYDIVNTSSNSDERIRLIQNGVDVIENIFTSTDNLSPTDSSLPNNLDNILIPST